MPCLAISVSAVLVLSDRQTESQTDVDDRQPPSTDCSTCPLQHLWLSFLHFCWSYNLEFTARQSAQLSCWARSISKDSENSPVKFACCYFFVFSLHIRAIQMYIYLLSYLLTSFLTYLLTYLLTSRVSKFGLTGDSTL